MSLLHCSGLQPSSIEIEIKTLEHSGQQEPSFHAFFCPFITLCRFITLRAWCLQTVSETVGTVGWNFQRHTSSSWSLACEPHADDWTCQALNAKHQRASAFILGGGTSRSTSGSDSDLKSWLRMITVCYQSWDPQPWYMSQTQAMWWLRKTSNAALGNQGFRFGLSHWEIQAWVCLDLSEIRFQTSIGHPRAQRFCKPQEFPAMLYGIYHALPHGWGKTYYPVCCV